MNGKRRLLGSFNHGSMANAMPQALGAQATEPERQVVAMCGDGGFSMLMGDFLSVVQMKLPVKIIVFNNSVLGFVAMEMKAGGYLTDGTELHDTNFARIAEACGITGIRVEKASEVDEAPATRLLHRRSGDGGCGGRQRRVSHSTADQTRTGQRFQPVYVARNHQRTR